MDQLKKDPDQPQYTISRFSRQTQSRSTPSVCDLNNLATGGSSIAGTDDQTAHAVMTLKWTVTDSEPLTPSCVTADVTIADKDRIQCFCQLNILRTTRRVS